MAKVGPLKLNFEQQGQILKEALDLHGQKPKHQNQPLVSSQKLFLGTTAWLARQPISLQKMVNHLGVYSYHSQDLELLKNAIVQDWKESFYNRTASWHTEHEKEMTAQPTEKTKSSSKWQCSLCDLENPLTQSHCALCDKEAQPSKPKTFKFDVFSSEPRPMPKEVKRMTLEEEAEAVFQMRNKKEPFTKTSMTMAKEKPNYNHVFPLFSESEQAEQEQVIKMFQELETEEKVTNFQACSELPEDYPRYLFALFKKTDAHPSQILILDKVNHTVEWFDSYVPPVTMPVFTPDPRISSLAKSLHSRPNSRPLPDELSPLMQTLKDLYPRWTVIVNKHANKQLRSDQGSDFFALWYLMMRFGYERKGGPQSPEQLDETTLPFSSAKSLFSEFFQEE